jgi:predicted GNAT superfamily acetyltransferase
MPLDLYRSRASDSDQASQILRLGGLTYRPFATPEDANQCVELQGEIWGSTFDRVPASILRIAAGIGGLAIGAFDDTDTLVGFVFSLTGMRGDEPIHWSHMLGVREDVRGMGVGRHLKEMQRAELARRGVACVLWTFDPLQARNAHLNFNRLGVRLVEYVENMYGVTSSPLHHGLPTDRLVVMLPTTDDAVTPQPASGMNGSSPILTPFPRVGDLAIDLEDANVSSVLIEIPADLQKVMSATPDVASTWRMSTRVSFQRAIHRGYEVTGLRRDLTTNRAFYTLVAANSSTSQRNP